jgi:transposase IS4 family protein (fragment)
LFHQHSPHINTAEESYPKFQDARRHLHFKEWVGIKIIHQFTHKRYDKCSGKETIETSYYIGSVADSKHVYRVIRNHWKKENQLHYILDVYLGEDDWSKRAEEVAKNIELLAKINLFILQRLKASSVR